MKVSKKKWHYRTWLDSRRYGQEIPERVDFCEYWGTVTIMTVNGFFSTVGTVAAFIGSGLLFIAIWVVGNLLTIPLGFGTVLMNADFDFFRPFKPIRIFGTEIWLWKVACPLWGFATAVAAFYFLPLWWNPKLMYTVLRSCAFVLGFWGFLFGLSFLSKRICKEVTFEQ